MSGMSIVIQATTISGKVVDNARWEVDGRASFNEGQTMSVSVPTKDGPLLGFLSRGQSAGCMLDGQKGSFSVILTCVIKQVRHMVETASRSVDTLVVVVPVNRTAEQVLLYMMSPQKCDPRFVRAIREAPTAPS